jgi:hypothetical protein
LIVSLFVSANSIQAQQARLLPSEDPAYETIERLQRRGYLRDLNPVVRPYTFQEIRSALDRIDPSTLMGPSLDWYSQLSEMIGYRFEATDEIITSVSFNARLQQTSSERYDVMRPYGTSPRFDPAADIRGSLAWRNLIVASGFTFDMFYDRDPDGLDVVNRLFMRGEDTYLGFQSRFLDVHLGRFGTHWNRVGQEAPLIGDDARQYDKLQLRLGTERISLRSLYGELDNLDNRGEFSGRGFQDGSIRRYIFAHRIDWRPGDRWTISLIEGDLISGGNAGLSLKYLQPLHFAFFESDNTPKNFENNLMVGGSLHYQGDKLSVSSQVILDDIVVKNRKQLKDDGLLEPATGQINMFATLSDVLPNLDFGLQSMMVSSLSYRTDQKEGQWTYAQRGLGAQFVDYVHTRIFLDWYAWNLMQGLTLSPSLQMLAQGKGDYKLDFDKYYDDDRLLPNFLSGVESITYRASVGIDYRLLSYKRLSDQRIRSAELIIKSDIGINKVSNKDHIRGLNATEFQNTATLMFKVGF